MLSQGAQKNLQKLQKYKDSIQASLEKFHSKST